MKRMKIILVVLGIPIVLVVIFFVLPLGALFSAVTINSFFDNTPIKNSKYIGYVVSVAPVGTLVKRNPNSDNWRDKTDYLYLNILGDMPQNDVDYISNTPLDGFSDFEVFDVKRQSRLMSGEYTICFLRNIKNHAIVFTEECEDLSSINSFTNFYKLAESEIHAYGSLYFTAYPGFQSKKNLFKVNRVETYKANSIDEMFNILIDQKEYGTNYSRLYWRRPYFMKFRNDFHEDEFSKFYRSKDFIGPSLDRTDWSEILKENDIPKEVKGRILTLFPTSLINRWVLINMFLLNKDAILSMPIVNCLSKHLEGSQDLVEETEKVTKFLGSLRKKLILEQTDSKNVCNRLSPPILKGEGKIIPMSFE